MRLLTRASLAHFLAGYIDKEDQFGNVTPGNWRHEIDDVCNVNNNPSSRPTIKARKVCCFFEEGVINFQWKMTE